MKIKQLLLSVAAFVIALAGAWATTNATAVDPLNISPNYYIGPLSECDYCLPPLEWASGGYRCSQAYSTVRCKCYALTTPFTLQNAKGIFNSACVTLYRHEYI